MACETEQAQLDAAEVEWHAYQEDCAAGDHNACRDALAAYNKVLVLRQKLQQCLAPPPPSNLAIAGIERTQATQFFNWNGQGTGTASNNSLPLVAGKALTLRVYVNTTFTPGAPTPASVNGTVSLSPGPASVPPVNGPIAPRPAGSVLRENADHTLNFFIAPGLCHGPVTFSVVVFDPAHHGEPAFTSPTVTFTVVFAPPRFIRIFGVLLKGRFVAPPTPPAPPDPPQGPPTFLELLDSLSFAERAFPISGASLTGHVQKDFDGDLRAPGSGCGPGWDALLTTLSNMRAASGGTEIYLGLVPTPFTPTQPKFAGCGGGFTAAAYAEGPHIPTAGPLVGHELGHVFGRKHAPCPASGMTGAPDPASVDTSYPSFGPMLPAASIGEFGYDPLQDKVFDPTWVDFMSYCPKAWISPYTYAGLGTAIATSVAASPTSAAGVAVSARGDGVDAATGEDAEAEYLHLNFRIRDDGHVDLLPSFHLEGPAPTGDGGVPTAVSCELLGADDRLLMRWRCHLADPYRDIDDPDLVFHEHVPWHPETRTIAFRRRDQACHRYEIEAPPPEIAVKVEMDNYHGHVARVSWEPTEQRESLTYLLRYSPDAGRSWRALDADLTAPNLDVDLDSLPGGDRCRFQIVASAGIRTTVAESEEFAVPVKPVQGYILEPEGGAVFDEGAAVVLRGGGFSPDFGTITSDDVAWTSSVQGMLGVGHALAVWTLVPGRHRITMSVPDGAHDEVTAAVLIEVRSRARNA